MVIAEAVSVVGLKLFPLLFVITTSFGNKILFVPSLPGILIIIGVVVVREETEVILSEEGLVNSPAARREGTWSVETLAVSIDGAMQEEVSKLQLMSQAKLPLE